MLARHSEYLESFVEHCVAQATQGTLDQVVRLFIRASTNEEEKRSLTEQVKLLRGYFNSHLENFRGTDTGTDLGNEEILARIT